MDARISRLWKQMGREIQALDESTVESVDGNRSPLGWSPLSRAVVTIVSSGFILTLLHYVILQGMLQEAVVRELPLLITRLFGGAAGAEALRYSEFTRNAVWALGSCFFYVVLPIFVIRVVLRESVGEWYVSTRGYFAHSRVYLACFVPVALLIAVFASSPAFQAIYPFYKHPISWSDFLLWEALYAVQFVALEFFFRGFMLRGLSPRFGVGAVLFMIVPYAMVHFHKPIFETFGAVVAGGVLGLLALRTRSIWGGATIHIAVAFTMDAAALMTRPAPF